MPKNNVNYQNTYFYKLCSRELSVEAMYIGSTTNWSIRKAYHKHNCNNSTSKHYNDALYIFIRENKGWDFWQMVQIEKRECCDKIEVGMIERQYIEQLGGILNSSVAPLTRVRRRKSPAHASGSSSPCSSTQFFDMTYDNVPLTQPDHETVPTIDLQLQTYDVSGDANCTMDDPSVVPSIDLQLKCPEVDGLDIRMEMKDTIESLMRVHTFADKFPDNRTIDAAHDVISDRLLSLIRLGREQGILPGEDSVNEVEPLPEAYYVTARKKKRNTRKRHR